MPNEETNMDVTIDEMGVAHFNNSPVLFYYRPKTENESQGRMTLAGLFQATEEQISDALAWLDLFRDAIIEGGLDAIQGRT